MQSSEELSSQTQNGTDEVTPRQRAPLSKLLAGGVALAAAGWLSGHYLRVALEVRGARFVALLALPPAWVYAIFCLSVAAVAIYVAAAWLRGVPPEARAFRLPAMLLVLIGALHFLVLPTYRRAPVEQVISAQLELFREMTDFEGELPADPGAWAGLTTFPPPFLRDGEPIERWNLLVRRDCEGPVTEAPAGVETGTMIICIGKSGLEAWITPVAVDGEYAGDPAVLRYKGQPVFLELRSRAETIDAWQRFPDEIRAANEESPAVKAEEDAAPADPAP